jgi:hypothetical protein
MRTDLDEEIRRLRARERRALQTEYWIAVYCFVGMTLLIFLAALSEVN